MCKLNIDIDNTTDESVYWFQVVSLSDKTDTLESIIDEYKLRFLLDYQLIMGLIGNYSVRHRFPYLLVNSIKLKQKSKYNSDKLQFVTAIEQDELIKCDKFDHILNKLKFKTMNYYD